MAAAFSGLRSLCPAINKKPSDYWWGRLRVQLHACMGRSEEWLELRWAKHSEKCSLVRLQIRREGGGWDRCWLHVWGNPQATLQGTNRKLLLLKHPIQEKVLSKVNASLISVKCVILWHFAASIFHFWDGPNAAGTFSTIQYQYWVNKGFSLALAAANRNKENESQVSPRSPDTSPDGAQTQHLITFPTQSITEAHCILWSPAVTVSVSIRDQPDKDKERWLWLTSSTLLGWAVASRSTF